MQLPLSTRAMILDELATNVAAEYDQLAEQALREDIALVEKRLAEFHAGETETFSWEEAREFVFGKP